MKQKLRSLFLAMLFMTGIGLANTGNAGVTCSSACTAWSDCSIKIDCDELCVEHNNSFECGSTTYDCGDSCGDPVIL